MDANNIRGEVVLSGPEYDSWMQRLNAALGDGTGGPAGVAHVCWRLAPIELPQRIAKPQRSYERLSAMSSLATSMSEVEKPKHKARHEREPRAPTPEPEPESLIEYDPSNPICKLLTPCKEDFDSLPEWSKSLHGLLVTLCRTPGAEAFVSTVGTKAASDQTASADATAASVTDTAAATNTNDDDDDDNGDGGNDKHSNNNNNAYFDVILSKLLNGDYKNSTEALNELYMVLVAAFRVHVPGSDSWMAAQYLSQRLQHLRQRCNLLDAQRESSDNTQFVQRIESSFRDASIDPFEPIVAPVTNKERLSFYQTLLGLGLDDHLELFTKFEHSAIWKSVQEGEIELDDQATDPQIFRRMLDWALSRRSRFLSNNEPFDVPRGMDIGGNNVMQLD